MVPTYLLTEAKLKKALFDLEGSFNPYILSRRSEYMQPQTQQEEGKKTSSCLQNVSRSDLTEVGCQKATRGKQPQATQTL